MGATFRVPTADWEDAPGPKIALAIDAETPLWDADLPERVTFVLGAEREGLPPEVVDACDLHASIPLAGRAESLNVAMAGTVALYEHRRRAR
jgi:TrmH family RNA methyltransferase